MERQRSDRKRASTEGYQTQHPDVQFCVWGFWNCPPPLGVFQVPRRRLIDVGKFGLTFEKCNRTSGWAVIVHRVRKDGHYQHGMKMTIIFAIEPGDPALPAHVHRSVERPLRWIRCLSALGTTTNIFRDFCGRTISRHRFPSGVHLGQSYCASQRVRP